MAITEDDERDGVTDRVFTKKGAKRGRGADFDVVDGENDVTFFKADLFGGGIFEDFGDVGAVVGGEIGFESRGGVDVLVGDAGIGSFSFAGFDEGF